jgi:hypothetical protein
MQEFLHPWILTHVLNFSKHIRKGPGLPAPSEGRTTVCGISTNTSAAPERRRLLHQREPLRCAGEAETTPRLRLATGRTTDSATLFFLTLSFSLCSTIGNRSLPNLPLRRQDLMPLAETARRAKQELEAYFFSASRETSFHKA